MFFRAIEYIRRQPKAVREQYAFGLTIVVVGSIGLIWLVMLPGRFANVSLTETREGESARPFSQLLSQFQNEPAAPAEAPVATSSSPTARATTSAATLELTPETLRQVASATAATTTPTSTPDQAPSRTVRIATTSDVSASSSAQ